MCVQRVLAFLSTSGQFFPLVSLQNFLGSTASLLMKWGLCARFGTLGLGNDPPTYLLKHLMVWLCNAWLLCAAIALPSLDPAAWRYGWLVVTILKPDKPQVSGPDPTGQLPSHWTSNACNPSNQLLYSQFHIVKPIKVIKPEHFVHSSGSSVVHAISVRLPAPAAASAMHS